MSELNGIIKTRGSLKGTVNTKVKTKATVSVGGTLISSQTSKRGIPGTDGYSPSASVSKVGNKATITITDKDGTTTADIYDGSGGGASAFIAEYGVTTYAEVKDAYDEDAIIICTVDDSGNTAICQLAYFDDANDIFFFAEPRSDGVYWASIAIGDTWDDGNFLFASTDTATQLRDGLMTALDKQKLDGIASGAEVNVNADWNAVSGDAQILNKPTLFSGDYDDLTNKPTIPSKTSDLTNDSGFISSETDPVFTASAASGISSSDITSWNGKSTVSVSQKTSSGTNIADITINGTTTQLYAPQGGGGTITDVTQNGTSVVSGGVAAVTVPTKVSDLNNDSGFITTETDPTVPSWAKQSSKPSYTFSEIGSKPTTISGYGITDAKISNGTITLGNNTITPLTSFTETDPTVPSWAKQSSKPSYTASEVGAVPTTRKVNGKALSADITLTATDVSALPASTAIPSKTSDLTNDSGFLTAETDPVFTASDAYGITASDISNWNGKDTVSVSRHTTSGTNIADITISGTTTKLYAPTSGGTTGTLVQLVRW